ERLRGVHAAGAEEYGAALLVQFEHAVGDGRELALLAGEDAVAGAAADHRLVRRHADDGEAVPAPEFGRDFPRGAGHAAQALVPLEVALVADARARAPLIGDLEALLCFDGLVQAELP